ncbi:hypothetical protein BJY00DRAFT_277415 [Aspergillus carlsbadensis]|nr:hypothetical protein BJY00DRAFT_277415 [Aspergillus carlsbadensis]
MRRAVCCAALNNFTITQPASSFALAHRSQRRRSPGSTIGGSLLFLSSSLCSFSSLLILP